MNKQTIIKIAAVLVLGAVFAALYSQFGEYANLGYIKEKQAAFQEYYAENRAGVLAAFFFGYILVTALSLPGAAIMTLLAGALFGLLIGTIVVSFASSMGATLAFLAARFILGESLQKKYGDKLQKINEGIEREGKFYLFTMRLIPAFPFFLINILMGLTKLPALSFYWVSQLGMLAGTVVYVFAGTQLAEIDSLAGILSPGLIAAFIALGVFPLAAKKAVAFIQNRRAPEDSKSKNSAQDSAPEDSKSSDEDSKNSGAPDAK
ncbi:MAG: TVP38/TMEM64 family protein [Gammaproteobacteria bacterium]